MPLFKNNNTWNTVLFTQRLCVFFPSECRCHTSTKSELKKSFKVLVSIIMPPIYQPCVVFFAFHMLHFYIFIPSSPVGYGRTQYSTKVCFLKDDWALWYMLIKHKWVHRLLNFIKTIFLFCCNLPLFLIPSVILWINMI